MKKAASPEIQEAETSKYLVFMHEKVQKKYLPISFLLQHISEGVVLFTPLRLSDRYKIIYRFKFYINI